MFCPCDALSPSTHVIMSQVLKCNVCNIVIDELLAYVQNKISVIDEETLKRICVSAFTSSEISKSKSLLFESLPTDQRKITRKRKGKEGRDLDDIVSVFKSTDPDVIPVFVAKVLEKLPPILFDHLDCTKLLKDITKLNSEVENIMNTYATVKQLEDLRADIHELKHASLPPPTFPSGYVNMRRGAWNLESGPIGMTLSHNYTSDEHGVQQSHNSMQKNSPASMSSPDTRNNCQVGIVCTPLPRVTQKHESPNVPVAATKSAAQAVSCVGDSEGQEMPFSKIVGPSISKHTKRVELKSNCEKEDTPWQTVNKKKKQKYRYLGARGKADAPISSFKAANKKIPIFITNVHMDTLESDIVNHIKLQTQERVFLEKINTKKVLDHKAYKFFVSESKVDMFLDETTWPEGIIFRRFVHYKYRKADGGSAAIGPVSSNNG